MHIKQLFNDDNAVSPVIGVILMVAITVILAATVATFVLGLGEQDDPAPTANFDFEYDSTASELTITHTDGDEIDASQIFVRGELDSSVTAPGTDPPDDWESLAGSSVGTVAAGNSVTLSSVTDSYVVRVVWEDPDSDQTSTLSTDSGPDA